MERRGFLGALAGLVMAPWVRPKGQWHTVLDTNVGVWEEYRAGMAPNQGFCLTNTPRLWTFVPSSGSTLQDRQGRR